ncbi:MAG: hypothetical protein EXS35_17340 [Pedosphaera sp.]|nr:hypothetical protein [Pedosphaera sp.]
MNPSTLQQTTGNVCVGIATLIFLLPLQHLLWEFARKHVNDNQWVTSALFILIPLWLLLMGALLCVTASGGFDWLRLGRPALYTLTVAASLALAVVTFVFIALYIRPGFTPRFLYLPVIYLISLTTVLLVVLSLNPKLAPGLPLRAVNLSWTVCAAISLALCGGYLGYRLVTGGGSQIRSIAHRFSSNSELSRKNIAQIPTLDPKRSFTELLRLAGESQDRDVRDAALVQLRSNPDWVASLVAELTRATPSSGELDHALALVDFASFTPEEQKLLALPARNAMDRITKYMHSELRFFLKDKSRRKGAHRWGNRLFQSIATKLAGAGVDFQPALDAFEKTFTEKIPDNE